VKSQARPRDGDLSFGSGGVLAAEAELLFSFVAWNAIGGGYRNEALESHRRDHGA
jgi:hypothetical protein